MRRSARRPALAATVAVLALVATSTLHAAAGPAPDPVIVAVGDLACQSFPQGDGEGACRSDEIADLIRGIAPSRFLALGDLQYNKGSLGEFMKSYDLQFGDLKPITLPATGNHEYGTTGAADYFTYWGGRANPPLGYYSVNVGDWHVVALNSDICDDAPGCGPGTPQYEWLKADLRANRSACTLAFQHHPRWDWRPYQKWVDEDAGTKNAGAEVKPYIDMVKLMDVEGVDVLLTAHNHLYMRWAPQSGDGKVDPKGITEFVVGTGGRSLYPYGKGPRPANLRATQNKAFGVLQMTLHPTSYDYRWVPLPGEPAFGDAGTVSCA